MSANLSFCNVTKEILKSIENNTIKDLYSKFTFLTFSFQKYIKQQQQQQKFIQASIENFLFSSLKDFKFITVNLSIIKPINQIITGTQKEINMELENKGTDFDINAFFCCEGKCYIFEEINFAMIKSLIDKLKDNKIIILNIFSDFKFIENLMNENELKEEIQSFCSNFMSEMNKNIFVKKTISLIVGYTIYRFFFPSHYFQDSSFFDLYDENKSKENQIKSCIFKLLFTKPNIIQISQIISEIKSLKNEQNNNNNIKEFKSENFIKLRNIYTNKVANYYLVIHCENFHIFMMKELLKPNEPKREINFCYKYSHRCFTRFYGFVKKDGSIKAIIYEYMCNLTLNEYINKIDNSFSLLTIIRLFQGLGFLYSNNLIHRDIKPTNIFIDHNYLPYISDFETIREPVTDESMTNDIGSILYSSPEQDKSKNVSFQTDIYSFGLLIYYLYQKKDFIVNAFDKSLNQSNIENIIKSKIPENLKDICIKCIIHSYEKRPEHSDIKKAIIKEIKSFIFIDLINEKYKLIQLIYEKSLIQNESNDELINWIIELMKMIYDQNNDSDSLFYLGILYAGGLGVKKNYSKAKDFLELAAKQSHSNALLTLGVLYAEGQGVEQNYLKAKEYYELAAKQNNSDALFNLAKLYEDGHGVRQNYLKAKEYFELSAKQNNSDALFCLGIFYMRGLGVEQNYLKAKEYFELAAKQNDSNALYNLGRFYYTGKGVEKNYFKAKEYYELAAKQNHPNALLDLGIIYAEGFCSEKNYLKAKECFELAAKQNDPKALFNLGYLYSKGLGVDKNFSKAIKYFELSAKQNDSDALYSLGNAYYLGEGVEQNFLKAKEFYELSAKQNNSSSLFLLGIIYEQGHGVPKDILKAKECFELSAEKNNSLAYIELANFYLKYKLTSKNLSNMKEFLENIVKSHNFYAYLVIGNIYFFGLGVEQDYIEAKKYYEKAAIANISDAYLQLGKMYLSGLGVEQDFVQTKINFEYASQLNNTEAIYSLGNFYSNGDIFDINIPKAIQYFKKCMKNKYETNKTFISDLSKYFVEKKYNEFYYRSMNDIGLIYLIFYKDVDKANENIKEAAFAEYPFGQNNYGLLFQFYFNNFSNAEYFYKRSSMHQFALADYNLGYLKEIEGKNEEAIEYYIKASEHEDVPLKFHGIFHIDKRLIISKIFIMCYVNIKLAIYYFKKSNFDECKKYFIKSISKIIDLKNDLLQKQFKCKPLLKNFISFLKLSIFWFPLFNLYNQPNLITKEELIELIKQSNFEVENEEKNQEKCNLNENEDFNSIFTKEGYAEIIDHLIFIYELY